MIRFTFVVLILVLLSLAFYPREKPALELAADPQKREPITDDNPRETYFAEIDENGIVLRVIVADQKFIDSGSVGSPKNWIQTDMDGKIRKNPAVEGAVYDEAKDAFIPPKRYDSWVLDEATLKWKPPKPVPVSTSTDNAIIWNEKKQDWEQPKQRSLQAEHLSEPI